MHYTLLGILALILSACIVPVGIPEGQEPPNPPDPPPPSSMSITFGYANPGNDIVPPKADLSNGVGSRDSPATIYISSGPGKPNQLVVAVTNSDQYNAIQWYCEDYTSSNLSTYFGYICLVTAGTAPFNLAGRLYQLTVIGTPIGESLSYSAHIYIEVEP
jgi:hypothetical protein